MATDKMKIVVMGGSYNPPTIAHYRLMMNAVDALDADKGLFVPVSDAYLKRKMRRDARMFVLTPEIRIRMLRSMCTDSRLDVCEKEIGTIEPRTVPTLEALQEDYPLAELYFVMGADKLGLLSHLTEKCGFLDRFRAVLYSREGSSIEQEITADEILNGYHEHIVILPVPEGVEGVSSTLVRNRMLAGESSKDLLIPEVAELFGRFTPKDFPEVIRQFKGDYSFLSNHYPCWLEWRGQRYKSAEAAFKASSDGEALKIMESILQAKFNQNPTIMEKLKQTGTKLLINGTNNDQTFWGMDRYSWIGENNLGKILMKIREKETLK